MLRLSGEMGSSHLSSSQWLSREEPYFGFKFWATALRGLSCHLIASLSLSSWLACDATLRVDFFWGDKIVCDGTSEMEIDPSLPVRKLCSSLSCMYWDVFEDHSDCVLSSWAARSSSRFVTLSTVTRHNLSQSSTFRNCSALLCIFHDMQVGRYPMKTWTLFYTYTFASRD